MASALSAPWLPAPAGVVAAPGGRVAMADSGAALLPPEVPGNASDETLGGGAMVADCSSASRLCW